MPDWWRSLVTEELGRIKNFSWRLQYYAFAWIKGSFPDVAYISLKPTARIYGNANTTVTGQLYILMQRKYLEDHQILKMC